MNARAASSPGTAPIVGVAAAIVDGRATVPLTYIDAIELAGGHPVILAPPAEEPRHAVDLALATCDAFLFIGGEDPVMEGYGVATHPAAVRESPRRQRFEEALLRALDVQRPEAPTLGVCLGAQMMALIAQGTLNQHLPDDTPTHADHVEDRIHNVIPCVDDSPIKPGRVKSKHHQAIRDPGRLRVIARAHDGVIEAVDDPDRRFYLGVQWHPERTEQAELGIDLIRALVDAARR